METLTRAPSASKRVFQQAFGTETHNEPVVLMNPAVRHKPRACSECGATSTPQWRQGPAGPQTLCNACGVRFSRLMRKGSKAHRRKAIHQQQDDFSEDSVSDDTSKATTILVMPPPANTSNSPLQSNHPFQLAAMTPFIHEGPPPVIAMSRTRRRSYGPTITTSALPSMEVSFSAPALPPVSTQLRHRQHSPSILRLSSTSTATNLPTLSTGMPVEPEFAAAQDQVEDHEVDCEAALNLLSMAAGQAAPATKVEDAAGPMYAKALAVKEEAQEKPVSPPLPLFTASKLPVSSPSASISHGLTVATTAKLPTASGQQHPSVQQLLANTVPAPGTPANQQDSMQALMARMMLCSAASAHAGTMSPPISSPSPCHEDAACQASPSSSGSAPSASSGSDPTAGLDSMQALMSRLSTEEQHSLQQLCNRFDACFQEMVSAQAACEAVSQVLRAKQEAARAAQLAARAAAQMLLVKATQLSAHRSMLQAATAGPQAAAVLGTANTAAVQQAALHDVPDA